MRLVRVAVGAAAAVVGLLPWLLTGMRLPLQNLWRIEVGPEAMPVALLPFSQYSIVLIAAVILVGSALAGLAVRIRREGVLGALIGVLVVQIAALVQSAATVAGGLVEGTASAVYLGALVAGAAGSIVVGALVLLLIARAPAPGAAVGVSIAAIAAGSWLTTLLAALAASSAAGLAVLNAVQWLPGILAGLALAWCGLTSVGRVLAWVASLVLLWIGPTLVTAVSSAAGSRALAPYPLEMLDYGWQVFTTALLLPAVSLRTALTALVVGAVGFVALAAVERRRA
ncbi:MULTISPECIES: hypothetical protein [unclassified Rathayibacter]|uniref:hypothetical protein n=1 Tax=unclassified Rathayibacter TaxID=2609250 RepID=UPI0006F44E51|nr:MULTISPECIES: hypothetical protein [unclassified Rathayibacter]KQQ05772.1 hypothetical protein ASF42_04215 [Rathayibacter sp. Leaf294]KQS13630.1 hypothetical protein ASG06_04225 [Rathayibacter sp. Leaf185]